MKQTLFFGFNHTLTAVNYDLLKQVAHPVETVNVTLNRVLRDYFNTMGFFQDIPDPNAAFVIFVLVVTTA